MLPCHKSAHSHVCKLLQTFVSGVAGILSLQRHVRFHSFGGRNGFFSPWLGLGGLYQVRCARDTKVALFFSFKHPSKFKFAQLPPFYFFPSIHQSIRSLKNFDPTNPTLAHCTMPPKRSRQLAGTGTTPRKKRKKDEELPPCQHCGGKHSGDNCKTRCKKCEGRHQTVKCTVSSTSEEIMCRQADLTRSGGLRKMQLSDTYHEAARPRMQEVQRSLTAATL